MIVARTEDKSGQPMWLLGLSAENVRRLRAGEPIDVPLPDDAGIRIGIFGGRGTEDDLAAQLSEFVDLRRQG